MQFGVDSILDLKQGAKQRYLVSDIHYLTYYLQ